MRPTSSASRPSFTCLGGSRRGRCGQICPPPLRARRNAVVNYRPMGKSELEVSEVGFGVWTLASGRWGSFTDDQAVDLLHKAYDAGINYFDVSPTDGNGRGERLIGRAFGDKPELIIVSSKVGRPATGTDFSPEGIRNSLDGTLERLGSSYADVLQLHYPDAATGAHAASRHTLVAL